MRGLETPTRPARFRPVVEGLEDRTTPAAIQIGTSALVVTGNAVTVVDTGSNSASNTKALTVITDGVTQTFAGNITSITINGNPGGDIVDYVLGGNAEQKGGTGPLFFTARAQRTVTTNLDLSSRDSFNLGFLQAQTLVGAGYVFNVNGGNKGNNYTVQSSGLVIDSSSFLVLNLLGGKGNDNVGVNMGNTNVSPSVNPGFKGETAPPMGTAASRGSGVLFVGVFGLRGSDQLFVSVSLDPSAQGFVVGDVVGGSTHNTVGLVVSYPPTPPPTTAPTGFTRATLLLQLDGGGGTRNTGIHTSNVTALDLHSELVVADG
jgi:hypothetical protein